MKTTNTEAELQYGIHLENFKPKEKHICLDVEETGRKSISPYIITNRNSALNLTIKTGDIKSVLLMKSKSRCIYSNAFQI